MLRFGRRAGALIMVLAFMAVPIPPAGADESEEESTRCAWPLGSDGYCVTIRLTDVAFLCDKTAVDYGCTMLGNVAVEATGPAELPGYAGLWGFVDLLACPGVNGTCVEDERDISLYCEWSTGGGCEAAGSFTHTLRNPLTSDACEEMFGGASAHGYVGIHDELSFSPATPDSLAQYGWYEDC